jgi:hypothetical protein
MKAALAGIAAVSLLFTACASTMFRRVEDASLSHDQMAEVNFLVRVNTFNGKDVYDDWYKKGKKTASAVNVKIPAGDTDMTTTIIVDLRDKTETMRYTVSNVLFSFSFEPGKQYTVVSCNLPKPDNEALEREEYIVRMRVYKGIHSKIDMQNPPIGLIAEVFLFDTEEVCK